MKSGALSQIVKNVFSRFCGFSQYLGVCWKCQFCQRLLLCHRNKMKTENLCMRCPLFRCRRHLCKQWRLLKHAVSWCAQQNWIQTCSESWIGFPSVSIRGFVLLDGVRGSGGECCDCPSRFSSWLFCSSYHPSCADLAASVVPCRKAWVRGRRFGGAGSIGQTAVWTLLWFIEWLSVIWWAVRFQGGICRSTSNHLVLFVESYDGIMHVRDMSMATLSRVSRPSFGRLWPSGLVLVVWCPCRCRPWT